jgi:hypothetical protein
VNRIVRRETFLIAAVLATLVLYAFRQLLFAGADILPGTDASNLYGWELYTRTVLSSGRLPHWNPYLFAGTPHLADPQTTVLYPPALLLRWIPPAPFLSWMAVLHLWIGGVGAAVLARAIGLGWMPALAAGMVFALGGSVPGWIHNGHLLLIYGTAWLPWVLALVIVSSRRATLMPHPALIVVLVLQFLAGYLQGTVYVAGAAVAYGLFHGFWPEARIPGWRRWRSLIQLTVAGVIAAGVAVFQLWPTLLVVREAGRTAGIAYSAATQGGWTVADLSTFFFPKSGLPPDVAFRHLGDHTAYVGWVLAISATAAFFAREHRRIAVFFAILAAGTILMVMAGTFPFYRLHFLLLPGLRIPGRMLFIATLSMAILGAIGLDGLLTRAARRAPAALCTGLAWVLVMGVAADVLLYAHGSAQLSSAQPAPTVTRIPAGTGRTLSTCDRVLEPMDLAMAGRPALGGAGGVFLRDYETFVDLARDDGPLRMRRDLLDAAGVTWIVSCAPLAEPGLLVQSHVADVFVSRNTDAWPRAVWSCGSELVSEREAVDQLRQVRYDAQRRLDRRYFINIRWRPSIDATQRAALESRYHLLEGVRREGSTWKYALQDRSAANVRALLDEPLVEDTHGIDRPGAVLESDADAERQVLFGTSSCAQQAAIRVTEADQPGGEVSATVDAPVDGMVFLTEPYYPERQAFVDDVPVQTYKADVAFTAVTVPAGHHRVQLRYVPTRFRYGMTMTVLTLGACVLAWAGRQRRSRQRADTP